MIIRGNSRLDIKVSSEEKRHLLRSKKNDMRL